MLPLQRSTTSRTSTTFSTTATGVQPPAGSPLLTTPRLLASLALNPRVLIRRRMMTPSKTVKTSIRTLRLRTLFSLQLLMLTLILIRRRKTQLLMLTLISIRRRTTQLLMLTLISIRSRKSQLIVLTLISIRRRKSQPSMLTLLSSRRSRT